MSQIDIMALFASLYDDISEDDDFEKKKPLLAHYTTVETLEKIVSNNEIWFSNPLLMNDYEEVRTGFFYGSRALRNSQLLRAALETEERYASFQHYVEYYINEYDEKHLLDTYVFCVAEHESGDDDGLLSMWRGYGGNGRGVAIVFNSEKLGSVEQSPIIFSKVHYVSQDERESWLDVICEKASQLIGEARISDDNIYMVAYALVERIKIAALFSKHKGFREEQEWRAVYLSEKDSEKVFHENFHYIVGGRGVEPKFRLKFEFVPGVTPEAFNLNNIVESIILGPGSSSALSEKSIRRMLTLCGRQDLAQKLKISSIPYRPLG
ncbi:DUF2971 domain-containing protein [Methylopila sp. M107]|uniref:DUF2971 domain-containing protein n=1 Tax=Methylopila sp. M107 TaxID=1101190 RepID=UPI0009DC19B8|nr:DUF2971 domain-containing protein [Methylopila sp. M107]